jgi:GNAT superfamily N-acetyltransferase
MTENIHYRFIQPGEEQAVCEMVTRTYRATVAPWYPPEGNIEFLDNYMQPEKQAERLREGRFVLVATKGPDLVGMIEIRDNSHVSLFFVDVSLEKQRIGRTLLHHAIQEIKQRNPAIRKITVNSAPNAIEAYQHLGFRQIGDQRTLNGITTIPMVLELPPTCPE